MKPTAYLVNTARGPIVDTGAAGERARATGEIAGAALDVTDPEPLPADHPLLGAPGPARGARTSPRPRMPRARRWRTWRWTTCWPLCAGERMPHCANPEVYDALAHHQLEGGRRDTRNRAALSDTSSPSTLNSRSTVHRGGVTAHVHHSPLARHLVRSAARPRAGPAAARERGGNHGHVEDAVGGIGLRDVRSAPEGSRAGHDHLPGRRRRTPRRRRSARGIPMGRTTAPARTAPHR